MEDRTPVEFADHGLFPVFPVDLPAIDRATSGGRDRFNHDSNGVEVPLESCSRGSAVGRWMPGIRSKSRL